MASCRRQATIPGWHSSPHSVLSASPNRPKNVHSFAFLVNIYSFSCSFPLLARTATSDMQLLLLFIVHAQLFQNECSCRLPGGQTLPPRERLCAMHLLVRACALASVCQCLWTVESHFNSCHQIELELFLFCNAKIASEMHRCSARAVQSFILSLVDLAFYILCRFASVIVRKFRRPLKRLFVIICNHAQRVHVVTLCTSCAAVDELAVGTVICRHTHPDTISMCAVDARCGWQRGAYWKQKCSSNVRECINWTLFQCRLSLQQDNRVNGYFAMPPPSWQSIGVEWMPENYLLCYHRHPYHATASDGQHRTHTQTHIRFERACLLFRWIFLEQYQLRHKINSFFTRETNWKRFNRTWYSFVFPFFALSLRCIRVIASKQIRCKLVLNPIEMSSPGRTHCK